MDQTNEKGNTSHSLLFSDDALVLQSLKFCRLSKWSPGLRVSTASRFAQKWVLGLSMGVSKRPSCCKLSTHIRMSGRLFLLYDSDRDGTRGGMFHVLSFPFVCVLFVIKTKNAL